VKEIFARLFAKSTFAKSVFAASLFAASVFATSNGKPFVVP